MIQTNLLKPTPIYILLIVVSVALFTNLGSWGVVESSEARYAEIAREMFENNDLIHPRLLEIQHFHKPPITNWITDLSYYIFGVSAFSARFFLQISFLIQIYLVYRLGRLLFKDKNLPAFAAIIYASLPGVLLATRNLTTDNYLNTFILLSIFGWTSYRCLQNLWGLYIFYLFLAIGFLTKGPVVFIIPLFVIPGINLVTKKNHHPGWHHFAGLSIFFLVGLSWFIKLYMENKTILNYFVFDHTIDRLTTNNFGRSKPFWFYIAIVPFMAFPWVLILVTFFKKMKWEKFNLSVLFGLWVFGPIIFFSISSSKLIFYVLPIFPGIALGAAWAWQHVKPSTKLLWFWSQIIFQIIIIIGLVLLPVVIPGFVITKTMFGIILLQIITLVALLLYHKRNIDHKIVYTGLSFNLWLIIFSTFFFSTNGVLLNDLRAVTDFIKSEKMLNAKILVYNYRLPSVSFNLEKPIVSIYDGHGSLNREVQFELDTTWQHSLIRLSNETKTLPVNHGAHSVLISRKEVPENKSWLIQPYKRDTTFGVWKVYYNK